MLELVSKMYRKLKLCATIGQWIYLKLSKDHSHLRQRFAQTMKLYCGILIHLSFDSVRTRDIECVCIASLLPDTDSTPKSFHLHALLVTKTLVSNVDHDILTVNGLC